MHTKGACIRSKKAVQLRVPGGPARRAPGDTLVFVLHYLRSAIPSSEVSARVKAVMFRRLALAAVVTCLVCSLRLHAQVTATAPETEAPQTAERWDFYEARSTRTSTPARDAASTPSICWAGTARRPYGSVLASASTHRRAGCTARLRCRPTTKAFPPTRR